MFDTLGHLTTEKISNFRNFAPLLFVFFTMFSFISYNFINMHEYLIKIFFISDYKVKLICISIDLVPSVIH